MRAAFGEKTQKRFGETLPHCELPLSAVQCDQNGKLLKRIDKLLNFVPLFYNCYNIMYLCVTIVTISLLYAVLMQYKVAPV